ncbi:hypothetical protein CARUB_v10027831mg [Capsella rubella]|uniref:Transmembrane protein n=1 Tax=Capsella rubella TaxID=81985 RepID=R0EUA7_9BRAS|nr:uncharacterized protein LOC17875740 [Capsella rubella]EOA12677.1 hypothetical protein CARUB_v10027831mg [Capsella rubella]
MATKTSSFASLLLSFFIMLLFVSSQVGVTEAKHLQRNKLRLDCVPLPPPPPPPHFVPTPPIVTPPSKSGKGKGP